MKAVRIKMPAEFVDVEQTKGAYENWLEALGNYDDTKPHVYELAWEEGGVLSVHATEDGAEKHAALHIVKDCNLLSLQEVNEEFTEEDDCECMCHIQCECEDDEKHDPLNEDCYFENCGKEDCCTIYFRGKELADKLKVMFQKEEYKELISEWNNFWYKLKNAKEAYDKEEDFTNNILQIVHRVILS